MQSTWTSSSSPKLKSIFTHLCRHKANAVLICKVVNCQKKNKKNSSANEITGQRTRRRKHSLPLLIDQNQAVAHRRQIYLFKFLHFTIFIRRIIRFRHFLHFFFASETKKRQKWRKQTMKITLSSLLFIYQRRYILVELSTMSHHCHRRCRHCCVYVRTRPNPKTDKNRMIVVLVAHRIHTKMKSSESRCDAKCFHCRNMFAWPRVFGRNIRHQTNTQKRTRAHLDSIRFASYQMWWEIHMKIHAKIIVENISSEITKIPLVFISEEFQSQ